MPDASTVPEWLRDMEDETVLPRALGLPLPSPVPDTVAGAAGYGHRAMMDPVSRPVLPRPFSRTTAATSDEAPQTKED